MRSGTAQTLGIVGLAVLAGALGLYLGTHWNPPVAGISGLPSPPLPAPALAIGSAVPDLVLPDRNGQMRSLREWRGRPLVLNFWASWCAPCIEEMPLLDRIAREQGAQGTQVLSIALDEAAGVEAFLQRIPVSFPILLDTPGPLDSSVRLGNVRGVLPYSVLIDAEGRLQAQKTGPFSSDELADWMPGAN